MRKTKESKLKRWALLQCLRLLRIRDQSEKVARGFAVGLVINFFPTFGFGVLISGFVARMVGGSTPAGLIGGALLTFFWPVIVFFNLQTGSWFYRPAELPGRPQDAAPETLSTMLSGSTFMAGASLNALFIGLAAYLLFLFAYDRIRPYALGRCRSRCRGK